LRETIEETSNTDSALFLGSYRSEFAHFSGTIKSGARGEHIKNVHWGNAESKKLDPASRITTSNG